VDSVFGCFAPVTSPVQWRTFSRDAFADAEQGPTPIFLFIGAAWCPYSQRFLHDLQTDAAAVNELNNSYIPILVDGERRPDVQLRYPAEGWPGIMILEPGGEVLWASTHVPPGQLARLLSKVRGYFQENRREIRGKAQLARAEQRAALQPASPQDSSPLSESVLREVAAATVTAYDADNPGFALEVGYGGPKFPHFDAIEFLLALDDDGSAATIVQEALSALMERGLWDPEQGGLRRYAVERDWSRVHGERLLIDNARLLRLLCLAGRQLDAAALFAQAERVRQWCREVTDEASQAPVSLRPAHEDVPDDWAVPARDETIFVGAHSALVSAQLATARSLGTGGAIDGSEVEAALRLLEDLWERGRDARGVARRHLDEGGVSGTLHDQAALAAACLDAFEVSGKRVYRERAELVLEAANKQFKQSGGAFFDVVEDRDAPGRGRFRRREITANAAITMVALRLHELTRTDWYRETATEALAEFARGAAKQGIHACRFGLALHRYRNPAPVLIVAGQADLPSTQALHAAALQLPSVRLAVQLLDPLKDLETLTRFNVEQSREVRAYLSDGRSLHGPWRSPAEIAGAPALLAAAV